MEEKNMNIKTLKTKPIVALALALVMVMLMLFAINTVRAASPPVLSVVLSGTTSTKYIAYQSVGSSFSVDIRVDNTGSVSPGINSYSFSLTWNATVLSVTNVSDAFSGSFLNSGPNLGMAQSLGDLPVNNTVGVLVIGDIILNPSNTTACATGSGVLTTLTFTVLANGPSEIDLQPSDAGVAYLSYPDSKADSHNVAATPVYFSYGYELLGDINGEGKVNLADLVLLAQAYGSKPGDANWNPNADINGKGVVNLSDLVTLALHYGQTYP
jgi:hypothetical protein